MTWGYHAGSHFLEKNHKNLIGRLRRAGTHILLAMFPMAIATAALSAPPEGDGGIYPSEAVLQRIKVAEDITEETTDLLGDRIDLATGSLSFYHTDFTLPGPAGLDIVISRSWRGGRVGLPKSNMGDWTLEIPRIQTYAVKNATVYSGTWGQGLECSGPIDPWPFMAGGTWEEIVEPEEYFNGVNLIIPGKAHEKLKQVRTDGAGWVHVTQSNWRLSCFNRVGGGEGFLAQSPDGTEYIFDVWDFRQDDVINKGFKPIPTFHLYLYASKIRDRFGNEISLNYTGRKLTSITSSDGREVLIQYNENGVVSSVASDKGSWSYGYQLDSYGYSHLKTATIPDGKKWKIDIDSLSIRGRLSPDYAPCAPSDYEFVGTVEHPYGAKGTFTLVPTLHGRTEVPSNYQLNFQWKECPIVASLVSKHLDITGSTGTTWNYLYSENRGGFEGGSSAQAPQGANIREGVNAKDVRTTTVISPSGTKTIHQFLRSWNVEEGQEVRREIYDIDSTTLRRYVDNYFEQGTCKGDTGIYMENIRPELCGVRTKKTVITEFGQDGSSSTYTTENLAFNAYDTPTLVKEYNSVNSGWVKYTRLSYAQQDAAEVPYLLVNVPTKVEVSPNNSTWTTVSETTYHAASGTKPYLPNEQRRFGSWVQKYSDYFASGELKKIEYNAAMSGGGNRWLQFNDYYRGQPQNFSVPHPSSGSSLNAFQVINDDGSVASTTDFNAVTKSYQYDAMGRLSYLDNPSGWNDVTYGFVPVTSGDISEVGVSSGQYKRTYKQGNYERTLFFDGLLRPVVEKRKDLGNGKTDYQSRRFDAYGNLIFESYWSSSSSESAGISYTYDGLGRVEAAYRGGDAATTSTEYLSGNRIKVTNPRGHVTTTTYLAYGEPVQAQPVAIDAPEGVTTSLAYNLFGNLTSVQQGGITESYYYDGYQHLCRVTRPEFGDSVFSYTPAGELSWEARGIVLAGSGCQQTAVAENQKIHYAYNDLGRVEQILYPDTTPDLSFSYGNNGLLQTIDTSDGVNWTYNYNVLGLLDDEMLQLDSKTFVVDYSYNGNGHLSSLRYPSGNLVGFAPDALGRPTQAGSYATSAAYHANGLLKSFTYGNGIQHSTTLNVVQLPLQRKDIKGAANIYLQTASYDKTLNTSSITDGIDNHYSLSLSYDGLDRLDTAAGPWGSGSIDYDLLGNIIKMTLGSAQLNYVYDGQNRLQSVSGAKSYSFGYDGRGNVTHNGSRGFTYNLANQLISSGSNSYRYDGHNKRVKVETDKETVYSYYNQGGQLLYKFNADGTATDFIYLGSRLVAKDSSGPSASAPTGAPTLTTPTTTSTNGDLSFSWSQVDEATFYLLQWEESAGHWESLYNGGGLSTDTAIKKSGSHKIRVAACNAAGCGPFSAVKTAEVLLPPGAPGTITVPTGTDIDGSYTISWSNAATATSYKLEEQKDSGSWTQVASQAGISKALSGRGNGSYKYRVQACNSSGCSGWKTSGSFTVLLPPNPPASITVPTSTDTDGSYTISWAGSATATSYKLQEQKDSGSWAQVADQGGTSKPLSGKGNGSYKYQVQACNSSGCSVWKISGSFSVLHPPGVPTITAPAHDGDGTYSVSWNSVSTATSYTLEEKIGSGGWAGAYSGSGLSKPYSNRAENSYYYRAKACNASGCSSWSGTKTVLVAYPVISSFYASPSVLIGSGDLTTLHWNSSYADTCAMKDSYSSNWYGVPTNGSLQEQPGATTTYTLKCESGSKSAQATAKVVVKYGAGF